VTATALRDIFGERLYSAAEQLLAGGATKDVRILQDRDRLLAIMQDGRFRKRPALGGHAQRIAAE